VHLSDAQFQDLMMATVFVAVIVALVFVHLHHRDR